MAARRSSTRQGDTALALVFAAAVAIGHFADLVATQEQHLGASFAGIDLGGQGRGVRELQRHVTLPLWLEGRDVDDDAAARIRAFAQAYRQYITRDGEILDRAGLRK